MKNRSRLLKLLLSTTLALSFTACCDSTTDDNYALSNNATTGTDVTVVDGYVKDANVTDDNGQQATVKNASKGIYTFATAPAYPIKSTNGVLVATDLPFDINMSTNEGLVISPISTIIGTDTDISSNLLTSLAIADNAALQSDYISGDNKDLAKLAQVCYTILKDSAATTAFKASLKDGTAENNITDIIDVAFTASNGSAEKTQMQTHLNAVKAFSGDANTIETQLLETKAKLVYATPLTRVELDSLIADYTTQGTKAIAIKYANTSQITDLSQLLKDKPNFNLNISRWDTSKVTDMNQTFWGATGFDQNLSGWDVRKVTVHDDFNASADAWGSGNQPKFTPTTPALTKVELVTLITNYTNDSSVLNANLVINANTSEITNMQMLLMNKPNFNLNISSWDTSKVTTMMGMFFNATSFNQDISNWNTSSLLDMSFMFGNATTFNQDIGGWNTSKVASLFKTFFGATSFNQDIGGWNTSIVTNMTSMFNGATSFNQNISNWNTSIVTNMDYMFNGATAFNQALLTDGVKWDTSKVKYMDNMFNNATNFNGDISNWNISSVTEISSMFQAATAFNQDIGSWDTSSVTTMSSVFYGAEAFNQDISNWDTSSVTIMSFMFSNATAFNQPLLTNGEKWNTSKVTTMKTMFSGAAAFNQDIRTWDTSEVSNMDSMFSDASSFTNHDLSAWDTSSIGNPDPTNFFTGAGTGNTEPNW